MVLTGIGVGDKVDGLTAQANKAMSVFNATSQIATALEQTDIAQKIERGIQRFSDDIPWLMKGLDELARIHPVVTGEFVAIYVPSELALMVNYISRRACVQGCLRARVYPSRERS